MSRLCLLSLCVVLCACQDKTSTSSTTEDSAQNKASQSTQWLATTGVVPAYEQRAGNADKGRFALLNESYVNCGVPERVFRELQNSVADERPVVGVSGRDSSMDGLPYSVNRVIGRTGTPVVSSNCLTCHGTELFGELIIGLGNEFADFTQDASIIVERAGALVRGVDETAEWELFADRIAAIAPYTRMHTVGVNPANNLTFALISHRDANTNAWLAEPNLPSPPTDPPPVSVPPWWRMVKKNALFNLSEGRGDHARFMLAASMLCADSVDELNFIDQYAPDVRAYLSSLTPPEYPFEIDLELAKHGRPIFEANCAECHGSYGLDGQYPNKVVPIEVVNTDAKLMEIATDEVGQRYAEWFNASWYGELSEVAPAKGYVAPPLDGIWATAPYLHNGSVPNIQLLLNSGQRPTLWRHVATDANDPETYDTINVGWKYEPISIGSITGSSQVDNKRERISDLNDNRVYDTRREGYTMSGHTFGDGLSKAERQAVIEYLKTL